MKKILAIDDKRDNLIALSALLRNLIDECEVVTVKSGPEGIAKAESEQPDVILLDIRMPGMDGYEVCKILKSQSETNHIPVIMITAIKTDSESRIKGLELGADAFLAKPIDETELAAQVKAMLRIKKAEDALRMERDELAKTASRLEEFAYTVTHDLKSPLSTIGCYSTLLLEKYYDKLDEKGKLYLKRMESNIFHMDKLILDILELSRLGKVLDQKEQFCIELIVNQALENLKPEIDEKGIDIIISNDLPMVYGSKERLRQVYDNIISNAIKFISDAKSPTIEIGYSDKDDKHQLFYVKDNGIGIEKKYHEEIFQEFYRLNNTKTKGTGIGLAIAKRIIDQHDGDIWVESEEGKGSSFYFTLPKI